MEYFQTHLPPSGARGAIVSKKTGSKGGSTPARASASTLHNITPSSFSSSSKLNGSGSLGLGSAGEMGRRNRNGPSFEDMMGESSSGRFIAAQVRARLNDELGSPTADSKRAKGRAREKRERREDKEETKRARSPSHARDWDTEDKDREAGESKATGRAKGGAGAAGGREKRELEPFPLMPRDPARSKPRTGRMSPATMARLMRERDGIDDDMDIAGPASSGSRRAMENKENGRPKNKGKKNALQVSDSFDEMRLVGSPEDPRRKRSKEAVDGSPKDARKSILVPASSSQGRYTDGEGDEPRTKDKAKSKKDKVKKDVSSSNGKTKKRILVGSDEEDNSTDEEENGEAYFNRIHKMRITGKERARDHQAELADIMSIGSSDEDFASAPADNDSDGDGMDSDDGVHALTAEERQYCQTFIDPDERCPFCSGQMPLSPSAHLISLRARLEVVAASLPPGERLTWQRTIEFCSFHQAEIEVIPLGIRAGFPPRIDFHSIPNRIERKSIRSAVMRLIKDPVSPFFALAEKAIATIGKGRWSSMDHQSSEKVVNNAMPGYYGQLGRAILLRHYQNLLEWGLFPSDVAKTVYPLSPAEFIAHVVVPEVSIFLIMEDHGWEGEYNGRSRDWDEARSTAYRVWKDSIEYGRWRFRGDDERAGDVLEELQESAEEMRESCERSWGPAAWEGIATGKKGSGGQGKEAASSGMIVMVDSGSEGLSTPRNSTHKVLELIDSSPTTSSLHSKVYHGTTRLEDGSSDYGDDEDWTVAAAQVMAQTEMERSSLRQYA